MPKPHSRYLESAQRRFAHMNEPRLAVIALTDTADCLCDLGRYGEAAEAYQQTIAMAERGNDLRQAAVYKGQLATLRFLQNDHPEALRLYNEAREFFEQLSEPAMVATAWHQIGLVYQEAGQYVAGEVAYQKSLGINVAREIAVGKHRPRATR